MDCTELSDFHHTMCHLNILRYEEKDVLCVIVEKEALERVKKVYGMKDYKKDRANIIVNNEELHRIYEELPKLIKQKEIDDIENYYNSIGEDEPLELYFSTQYLFRIEGYYLSPSTRKICNLLNKATHLGMSNDCLSQYQTEVEWGDYNINYTYLISKKQLKNICEIAEQFVKEQEEIQEKLLKNQMDEEAAIYDKAKVTGEKQLIRKFTDLCDDEEEECSLDMVYIYALPNGETEVKRQHCY